MSEKLTVHDGVYGTVTELAEERGISYKEAVRDVFKEAGYEV